MKKVAFLDTVHPVLKDGLTHLGWECIDLTSTPISEIKSLIGDFHGIVIRSRMPMDSTFLRQANQLEFIARSGAGMENIDERYCQKENIICLNAPEGNRNAVGEQALGMLLSLFNNLVKANQEVKDGIWDREGNRGIELKGKTVGIIGFGHNGSAFAKKLMGFDVKILAYDKYKRDFGNDFVESCDLQTIFEQADVLSFHIPQNSETRFMADESFFESFKKSIYLINLARGKIVNTKALVGALKTGKVLGACLDVLEYEKSSFEHFFSKNNTIPEDFQYLIDSENVIISPHVGGWTIESYFELSNVLLEKIKKHYGL